MKEILTPCILQTIIICCTIISLAMIAVSAFRVWKEKEKHDSGTYIFISGSIVFIAITIFSYGFYQSNEILSFISLASSLISIILAVVTIIYSFYTNNRSASQVEKLNEAADDVKVAANDVKAAATLYNESAESLQDNIKKIISAIERVEQKADQILYANKATGVGGNPFANFDVNKYIDGYVNLASPLGILAMYACIKAKKAERTFNLTLLGDASTMSYCSGFLISTACTGMLNVSINFGNGDVSVIDYMAQTDEYVNKWVNKKAETETVIRQQKETIDSYFEVKKE